MVRLQAARLSGMRPEQCRPLCSLSAGAPGARRASRRRQGLCCSIGALRSGPRGEHACSHDQRSARPSRDAEQLLVQQEVRDEGAPQRYRGEDDLERDWQGRGVGSVVGQGTIDCVPGLQCLTCDRADVTLAWPNVCNVDAAAPGPSAV